MELRVVDEIQSTSKVKCTQSASHSNASLTPEVIASSLDGRRVN